MSRLLTCLFTGAGYNKMKSEHGITACAKRENIDAISKAVTHYAFSYGPVEDMHANGQCRLPRYLTKPRQRRNEWDMAGRDGISRGSAGF